jgi:hypothetical protein
LVPSQAERYEAICLAVKNFHRLQLSQVLPIKIKILVSAGYSGKQAVEEDSSAKEW